MHSTKNGARAASRASPEAIEQSPSARALLNDHPPGGGSRRRNPGSTRRHVAARALLAALEKERRPSAAGRARAARRPHAACVPGLLTFSTLTRTPTTLLHAGPREFEIEAEKEAARQGGDDEGRGESRRPQRWWRWRRRGRRQRGRRRACTFFEISQQRRCAGRSTPRLARHAARARRQPTAPHSRRTKHRARLQSC